MNHVYNNTRRAQQKRGQCADPGIIYHNGYRCLGYEEYQAMRQAEFTHIVWLAMQGKASLVNARYVAI